MSSAHPTNRLRLTSRRFALAAAAVVLGLSSCGDPSATSTTNPRPPVIQLAAGGVSVGGAMAGAESADAARSMMPWGVITYVYDGAFPDLASTAPGWSFPAGASVDTGRVAALAQVLGVPGEVRALPVDQGGGWMVGSQDGTGASLYVGSDGMLTWWFNPDPGVWPVWVDCAIPDIAKSVDPAPGSDESSAGSTEPGAPTDTVVPPSVCTEPEPPTGVPGGAEAVEMATALFTDLGYDPAEFDFEVYADDWGVSVTGFMLLDGMRSPITVSAGFGAEGALTWAGGSLARPERAGDFPLVSPEDALDRLNDETGAWLGIGYGAVGMESSRSVGVATSGGAALGDAGVATPATIATIAPDAVTETVTPALVDPMVPECAADDCAWPEPEPITIVLTGVRTDLTMVWDQGGTVWLLPAYTFTNADGAMATVVAVDDSFVQLPEPLPLPEPVPVTEPAPGSDPVTAPPATDIPAALDPDVAASLLIGLDEAAAGALAVEQGWEVRVVERDGEKLAATDDFRPSRVNVAVVDGIVTAVAFTG